MMHIAKEVTITAAADAAPYALISLTRNAM
jgi:hypothetical protein